VLGFDEPISISLAEGTREAKDEDECDTEKEGEAD
jgi:hypothetical protein